MPWDLDEMIASQTYGFTDRIWRNGLEFRRAPIPRESVSFTDVRCAREILIKKDVAGGLSKEEEQDLNVFEAILSNKVFSRNSTQAGEREAGSWTAAKLRSISSFHVV